MYPKHVSGSAPTFEPDIGEHQTLNIIMSAIDWVGVVATVLLSKCCILLGIMGINLMDYDYLDIVL